MTTKTTVLKMKVPCIQEIKGERELKREKRKTKKSGLLCRFYFSIIDQQDCSLLTFHEDVFQAVLPLDREVL
jgi:hypothetical protein